ncbi:HIT family protein [Deferrisoma sp.]
MTRKLLWAPWRIEYIRGPKPEGCVFCSALAAGDDRAQLVLRRGERCFVILNRYPYNAGHLMVLPQRHVGGMEDLTADEAAELWALAVEAKGVLQEALRPDGFNVGLNLGRAAGAGVAEHLHLHIVPRWVGDTNFLPVLDDVRVVNQYLGDLYDELRRIWPAGAPSY